METMGEGRINDPKKAKEMANASKSSRDRAAEVKAGLKSPKDLLDFVKGGGSRGRVRIRRKFG